MKLSENWLREWVDPGMDSAALGHRLTMLGLEVDSITPVAPPLDDVVVGKVTRVAAHPDADRLSLCSVDVGDGAVLSIVCGASNVQAGGHYPVARVGATLPGGLEIRRRRVRGEWSEGMLCSARELGLSDDADGLLELGPREPGQSISAALHLDDHVIDIDLTPNRADCFSVLGVARDIGASVGQPVEEPDIVPVAPVSQRTVPVELADPDACPRFAGRVIEGIDPDARTPGWMAERLRRCGIRPIHPVVDVTNYVMLEFGQPMHAYDLDRLKGGIVVRRASEGEKLVLLGNQSVRLDTDMLVIADHDRAVGLAGIMGGEATGVVAATRNILLESAFFAPAAVAGRARRLGLHTDASLRFERGVDPRQQPRAVEHATALLTDIVGGSPGSLIDAVSEADLPVAAAVPLRRERLRELIGVAFADAEVERLLASLGMQVGSTAEGWSVIPPTARFDINDEVDLIEEVVRLHGYDAVPEVPGTMPASLATATETRVPLARARSVLVDRGYREAITYSFVDRALDDAFGPKRPALALSNPISSELGVMRQSLWPGLSQALRYNLSHQAGRVRLFESGVRFLVQETDILEEEMLSGMVAGAVEPEQWDRPARQADLFDIKADLAAIFALTGAAAAFEFRAAEHSALRPGRSAMIMRAGTPVGWAGELHPAVTAALELEVAPVAFELSIAPALAAVKPNYREVSKFPSVRRDLAVVIDRDLPVAELEKVVREVAGPVLTGTVIFDIFTGENIETGYKSVALGLILQDTSRTLTDADVDRVMHDVVARLGRDFKATVRE